MEVSLLKAEIDILNEKLEAEREEFLDAVRALNGRAVLPPSKTNPDDDEWLDPADDYDPYDHELEDDHELVHYMIDPPSGWKYGFPKIFTCKKDNGYATKEEIETWLVANGYPQYEVDYWNESKAEGVPYRIWKVGQ